MEKMKKESKTPASHLYKYWNSTAILDSQKVPYFWRDELDEAPPTTVGFIEIAGFLKHSRIANV